MIGNFELIRIVILKETIDNLRDRRSVFNALFAVLFNPILYVALFGFIGRSITNQETLALHLPVVGIEHAPNLIQFLEQQDVVIVPGPADPEAAVKAGDSDLVLVIPPTYPEQFRAGQPAEVEIWADQSNQNAAVTLRRAERLVSAYGRQIGSLRLLARGIDPSIAAAVTVETVDTAPLEQAQGAFTLALLPTVMVTAAFFGGFYLAIDMTAGERERESLEPLLINPVPRWAIVMGKFVAALIFTLLATAMATALFLLLLAWPVVQDWMGVRFALDMGLIGVAIAIMSPVVFMAVALQIFIASYARTVKEAQTYVQLVAIAGFLPSVMLAVLPVRQQLWMVFIPTIGQLFLVQTAANGEPLITRDVFIASAVTMLIGIVCLVGAIRLYNQERIVLGESG